MGSVTRVGMIATRTFPEIGGIESHVVEVAGRIAARGYDLEVLVTDRSGTLPKREAVDGYTIRRFRAFPRDRDWYFSPGLFWAVAVALTETVGGLFLAIGFLTRLVCLPILIFLVNSISYHWEFGYYWNDKGIEYPLFWSIVVLHFMVHGGGAWSVDRRIGREI